MKRAITRNIIHTKAIEAFVVLHILMHDFSRADACYVRQWLASLFFLFSCGLLSCFCSTAEIKSKVSVRSISKEIPDLLIHILHRVDC